MIQERQICFYLIESSVVLHKKCLSCYLVFPSFSEVLLGRYISGTMVLLPAACLNVH